MGIALVTFFAAIGTHHFLVAALIGGILIVLITQNSKRLRKEAA